MYHSFLSLWQDMLKTGLREDGMPWDWTTLGTQKNPDQKLKAKIIAKSEGVWAAQTLVEAVSVVMSSIEAKNNVLDGVSFRNQDCLVELSGRASEILAIERPLLNLAAYVSGIASTTRKTVKK